MNKSEEGFKKNKRQPVLDNINLGIACTSVEAPPANKESKG